MKVCRSFLGWAKRGFVLNPRQFEISGKPSNTSQTIVMMAVLLFIAFALVLCYETRGEVGDMVTVDCGLKDMSVHMEKKLIPGYRLIDLRLLDPNCQPIKSENSSHITITTPLMGCGTTVEHTEENAIYKNVVKDGYARNAIIGRLQVLEIPFECVYLTHAAASLVQMNVEQAKVISLTPEDGSGAFELRMEIFKSEDYAEKYFSFPLVVTLQQRLYFQVSVDTPDTRLGIIADTCYATPINSLSKKEKYDIILNGCPKDDTVKFHSSPSIVQRFSFEAFQFVNGQVEPYLYVHCEVELCNLTDSNPSCTRECKSEVDTRLRREVSTDIYDLERGPIVILRNSEDSLEDEPENEEEVGRNKDPKSSGMTFWLFSIMGFICVVCLGAVIHTVAKAKQANKALNVN